MNINVRPIRTGSVRIKTAQQQRKAGGFYRIFVDREWTDELPVYAWLIEHPEGSFVVDTGETARSAEPGYFPFWHPYYRWNVRMKVNREEEIGPRLRRMGVDPSEVQAVVLTHLHTDHAGGLHHFPDNEIFVSELEWKQARGFPGKIRGYLPHRWPQGFRPRTVPFEERSFGPFDRHYSLTETGDLVIVPTPGHTPGHLSVIARADKCSYFFAGDATYTQKSLLDDRLDGISPRPEVTRETLARIRRFAASEPTVYLPAHDPDAARRLEELRTLRVDSGIETPRAST